MIVGFLFWIKDRHFFKEYALGLLMLSYAAFLTYMIYPATPPWLASSQGYLPPIQEITSTVMSHFLTAHFDMPSVYSFLRANPVAAIPSLHAAFPLLIFLFLWKRFSKPSLVFFPYVIGVWLTVMYLGEHYFIDVCIGALYAVMTFAIVEHKEKLLVKLKNFAWKNP